MPRTITISDDAYELIAAAATAEQTPEAYLEAWAATNAHEPDPDQAWFWTPEWQAKEREADADIAAGRVTRFESDEEFLRALDEWDADADK
jgi:hypothetical protein